MKTTLENLWSAYFAEECSEINTDEEKSLLKKAGEMHTKVNELLTEEQIHIVEKYIETLYEIQTTFGKKAFFKGCEFATSFLLEAGVVGKG